MGNKFEFDRVLKNVEAMKRTLPALVANQTQKFFADTFQSGGFEGKPWKTPKRKIEGTKEYKYPLKKGLSRRTKPTLVKAGLLRRAVSMSARVVTFEKIQLIVDLPYAARHNEGLDGMPKRQFIGDSPTLDNMNLLLIEKEVDKIWN